MLGNNDVSDFKKSHLFPVKILVNIFFLGLHIASLHISLLLTDLKSHFLKHCMQFECRVKDRKIKRFSKVYPWTDK